MAAGAPVARGMPHGMPVDQSAVSPFSKSQISYSDSKHYKNYFERDNNKDGYFRGDQI